MDPVSRITKFLDELAKVCGLDQEQIASLHIGDEREAMLLTSDLRRLLDIIKHKYGTDECEGCSDRDEEIERLRSDLALAQGQRDASNREIERLRDENGQLLVLLGACRDNLGGHWDDTDLSIEAVGNPDVVPDRIKEVVQLLRDENTRLRKALVEISTFPRYRMPGEIAREALAAMQKGE